MPLAVEEKTGRAGQSLISNLAQELRRCAVRCLRSTFELRPVGMISVAVRGPPRAIR